MKCWTLACVVGSVMVMGCAAAETTGPVAASTSAGSTSVMAAPVTASSGRGESSPVVSGPVVAGPVVSSAGVQAPAASAPATSPASMVRQTDRTLVLDNGLLRLTMDKASGQFTSVTSRLTGEEVEIGGHPRESFYWDCNTEPLGREPGAEGPRKGYSRFGPLREVVVVHDTPERAEVAVRGGRGSWLKFDVEARFVLFRGDPGWYSYVVFRHVPQADTGRAGERVGASAGEGAGGGGGARLWQTRFVFKANGKEFDTHFASEQRVVPRPMGEAVKKVMDATYLMADGSINTKYNNSTYWALTPVYGMAGKRLGVFSVSASSEYYNGGPAKQGQTVHDTTLLRVLQSVHFGSSPVDVGAGEAWEKVYGPVFTYVASGPTPQAMWASAQARQRAEQAKWPYAWVDHPAYAKVRGTVRGQWRLADTGANARREGAWVVLAGAEDDWARQAKGYQFFAYTDADGRFEIPDVVPGTYTLFVSGADQPAQFRKDGVTVTAGGTLELGTLDWTPETHGRTLWQVGVFDRTAREFRNGEDARHYQVFRRYQEQFPDDVTFSVGKSREAEDWSHAHWTWLNKRPAWRVLFDVPAAQAGEATLTVGVAAAQPLKGDRTAVAVAVNGTPVGTIALPKTGTAGYRGGVQDSKYNLLTFRFPASLLKAGGNELTLTHADAAPFPAKEADVEFKVGHVMYDAIRLEVQGGK